jgi:hypothetical protein
VHAGAVGLVALEQWFDVGDTKAAGEFFVHALAAFTAGFDVYSAKVVTLDQAEIAPGVVEALGDQGIAGDGDGAFDDLFEVAFFVLDRTAKTSSETFLPSNVEY